MGTVRDIGIQQDCYGALNYILGIYREDPCNLFCPQKFPCSYAQEIVTSLKNIATTPSCSFGRRQCTLYNLIENLKHLFSADAPFISFFMQDSNGFEYLTFIGTIGPYSIDLVMYKDLGGNWILLTDGSCVRTCRDSCCTDISYTVSRRKGICTLSCDEYHGIGSGENKEVCYLYDPTKDSCKAFTYTLDDPEIRIKAPKGHCNKVCSCFTLVLDLITECDRKAKRGCPIEIDYFPKDLPEGYKTRIAIRGYGQEEYEILGDFYSLGHFLLNLKERAEGYYQIRVELVEELQGGFEEIRSTDTKMLYVKHCQDGCYGDCDDDKDDKGCGKGDSCPCE